MQRLEIRLAGGRACRVRATGRNSRYAERQDTLVIAKQIDDIISLDPAEAYELSGIEVIANTYDRIMQFEPTDINKLVPRRRRKRQLSATTARPSPSRSAPA